MAEKFEILKLERKNGVYLARILFEEFAGDYEIKTDAHLSYLEFLPEELRFHILTKEDTSFNGCSPHIKIRGISPRVRKYETGLEEAFLDFAEEYSRE